MDWDSGSWVAVGYPETGRPGVDVFDGIDDLWAAHGADADRVVVDVPVGLCGGQGVADGCVETDGERSRRVDDLARRLLGRRSSSVFTPPCREAARLAAEGAPYDEVNAANREHTGKGLMRQAANIAGGIVDVERLLLGAGDPEVLVEGHPELCFRAFAGDTLEYSKRTAPGMDERLSALEAATGYEPGGWRRLAGELADRGLGVGTDDLVDALVLAETARAPEAEFQRLPPEPPTDAEGLPMGMVYRRERPFEVD